jgi:hypothetical protein
LIAALSLTFAWSGSSGVQAANPASGTVTSGTPLSWQFYPVTQSSPLSGSGLEKTCTPQSTSTTPGLCDNFDLTVDLTGLNPATQTATLRIDYTWTSATPTDMDVYSIDPTGNEAGPGTPDNISTGAGKEVLTLLNPAAGLWHIRSLCSTCASPQAASATATLTFAPKPTPPTPPTVLAGDPSFTNYPKLNQPNNTTDASGEVSIGADWTTPGTGTPNTVMWQDSNPKTFRVTFNDTVSPPTATWTDVTDLTQGVTTLDPIGFMDGTTTSGTTAPNPGIHRWFSTQLLAACSDMVYTDDDGGSNAPTDWTHSQGCPVLNGPDHETVGAGPYPASSVIPHPLWPHAVYYCSQAVAAALCGRSDNGGLSFGAGMPIYVLTNEGVSAGPGQCSGLHGHLRVAPDGTVYVPNKDCQDINGKAHPGVAISKDAGITWKVSTIPDGVPHSPGSDPSVAAATDNTVYYAYQSDNGNGGSHAMIAISKDDGTTWAPSVDVGAPFGIQNIEFPEVVAGDGNRAAFAFLGTTTDGSDQAANFAGVWFLYVSFTYDGGKSWITVNATPNDPVQRGEICTSGTTCGTSRNLLDFNDITVDRSGRVLVAYSDGCVAACALPGGNSSSTGFDSSLGTIARQNCTTKGLLNTGLFSAFDATGFIGCPAPTVARVSKFVCERHGNRFACSWRVISSSGIVGFNVYAKIHRLNARIIPAQRLRDYRYSAVAKFRGPFRLNVILRDGRSEWIPTR